jgi:AraC family transcriptional regulator, arabinose operon regulatory protein
MAVIRIREGFQGQKQWVIPTTILDRWAAHPLLQSLIPTDIGFYPQARYHYREREEGAQQHILIFCIEGSGWCQIDDQQHTVNPGEALLIPRSVPHIYGAADPSPWSIHWVHFNGTAANSYIYHLPENENVLSVDPQSCHAIESLFYECYESFVGGFVLHRLIFCAQLLQHLLGRLFFNNAAYSPVQRTSRFRSLESTLKYLHENITENLALSEMAAHADLSVSHFSYLFKQQTGYSPVDYFINLKMQHACQLLSFSSKSVQQIAYEIGYDDPYYFSRIFKKVLGVSPRQYRESLPG